MVYTPLLCLVFLLPCRALATTQEGIFTNGPASLQCMYKPAIVAYSNSTMINVKTHD